MNEIHRTIRISKDCAVCDVATHALQQATNSLVPVAFRFHAVAAAAMPRGSLDAVLAAWSDDYDNHTLLAERFGA